MAPLGSRDRPLTLRRWLASTPRRTFMLYPKRLVETGIYAWLRNPMYLGHLIFMAGLTIAFASWFALGLLIFHMWWFHRRVLDDEAHMRALFGDAFERYAARVKRWGVI